MLLDVLTVFFIVAGCVLLWFNVRPKRPHVIPQRPEDKNFQSAPPPQVQDNTAEHPLMRVLEQHLSEAQASSQSAAEDNVLAYRIAAGVVKAARKPNLP
jgi:hypothetical protein